MNVLRECYYVDEDSNDTKNFNKAITWLINNSRNNGGLIATLTIRNMETITTYPGMNALSKLLKTSSHKTVIYSVELELITELKIPYSGRNKSLLAVHPTKKFLDKLYTIKDIPKMMVVPWRIDEIDEWIIYSNAIKYGNNNPSQQELKISQTVRNALQEMTQIMNLANGMVHPRNEDIVIETFQLLERNGERLTKEDLKIFLIKNLSWDSILAEEASKLLLSVKAGKRHKFITGKHWNADTYNRWKGKK